MNLRQFLDTLAQSGSLRAIKAEADPHLEMAALMHRLPETPLLFEKVKGTGLRATGNIFTSRDRLAAAMGISSAQFLTRLTDAVKSPQSCPLTQTPACQQKVWQRVDLRQLPILKHFEKDGGPYVTSGVMIVDDPEFGRNAAFHRLMVIGRKRMAVRVVEGRGTHMALQHSGGELEVAIAIGAPPHVMVAGAMSPPPAVDELEIAQALAATPLANCLTNSLQVPAETEIVLEGRFISEQADEGPFVDLTGTWDFVRKQPVIEIDAITSREGALYEALSPGMLEHKALMGVPREADIYRAVCRISRCLDVRITQGGCSWLHAVVQIEKRNEHEPRSVIEAAFRAHPSLKQCVVVDADIDPTDPPAVEWALATRFQADRDTVILSGKPSSSLDPSAQHVPGARSIGAKLGMDATIKGADPGKFTRVPYSELGADRARELLGE